MFPTNSVSFLQQRMRYVFRLGGVIFRCALLFFLLDTLSHESLERFAAEGRRHFANLTAVGPLLAPGAPSTSALLIAFSAGLDALVVASLAAFVRSGPTLRGAVALGLAWAATLAHDGGAAALPPGWSPPGVGALVPGRFDCFSPVYLLLHQACLTWTLLLVAPRACAAACAAAAAGVVSLFAPALAPGLHAVALATAALFAWTGALPSLPRERKVSPRRLPAVDRRHVENRLAHEMAQLSRRERPDGYA